MSSSHPPLPPSTPPDPARAVGAGAPFVFAAAMANIGLSSALVANACLGAIGIAAFVAVAASCRQPATATV